MLFSKTSPKTTIVFLLTLGLFSCNKGPDEPKVVKSEGVFMNEIYASGDDWIEIYNAGDESKDLSGYLIYDDPEKKYALPANTLIGAKGFLILNCDDTGVGLNTNFKLSSSGETVYLENASGDLIDQVEFPELADGQSYARFPDGSDILAITGNISKGSSNGESEAPAFVESLRTPLVPNLNSAVTIQSQLFNNQETSSMKLYYRFNNGAYQEVVMTLGGSFYNGTIPAQNAAGRVDYYIEAKNNASLSAFDPAEAPDKVYSYLLNNDVLPALYINEFLAANSTCCPDTDGGSEEFDDWIEIYNASNQSINIAGMYLSDNSNNPFKHKMDNDNPALTTIPAGGFLLLWADGQKSQGPRHVDFSLSADGEHIGLYYIDGREIDALTFGAQSSDRSYGRSTDGDANWQFFNAPSPGMSNN